MAQLPEDIIDRLTAMERRIQQLSTAVNTRPAVTRIGGSIRIFDPHDHEIFADDTVTGGLARPWLTMLPPQDLTLSHWPQTSATAWTPIARSYNVVWQPQLRLVVQTAVGSGGSGQVQVLVNGQVFGSVVTAGTLFDHLGPICDPSAFDTVFGTRLTFEIQAKATTGTVYAKPQLMYGAQS